MEQFYFLTTWTNGRENPTETCWSASTSSTLTTPPSPPAAWAPWMVRWWWWQCNDDDGDDEIKGATWWGLPGIGYLIRGENRPRLFNIEDSRNILVENIFFLDSPYWTFWVHGVDGLEVRFCEIRFVNLLSFMSLWNCFSVPRERIRTTTALSTWPPSTQTASMLQVSCH